jgi:hypothetical protein
VKDDEKEDKIKRRKYYNTEWRRREREKKRKEKEAKREERLT